MNTSQRIRTISLADKMKRTPEYSKHIGLTYKELVNKNGNKTNQPYKITKT